jgi:hypothetical protein
MLSHHRTHTLCDTVHVKCPEWRQKEEQWLPVAGEGDQERLLGEYRVPLGDEHVLTGTMVVPCCEHTGCHQPHTLKWLILHSVDLIHLN